MTSSFVKIEKVVVNVGVGRLSQQAGFDKTLPEVMKELAAVTGQKPEPRSARISIAGFKSRAGQTIGLRVSLHGRRAKDFFERLVHVVLPRVKDFRGITESAVDHDGNINIGIREHIVFPEIIPEQSKVNFGLQVTAVISGKKNRAEAIAFWKSLGVPFARN
jgi:large subunit ribosomal protein L5